MKTFTLVVSCIWLSLTAVSAKPSRLIEQVNQLEAIVSDPSLNLISPATLFYTLVMLEEVSKEETKEALQGLTRSEEWRNLLSNEASSHPGWLTLQSTWWIDSLHEVSPFGKSSCQHFRTATESINLFSDRTSRPPLLQKFFNTHDSKSDSSLLLTQSTYRPLIPGGLQKAGGNSGEFKLRDGSSVPVTYLQSTIIPVADYMEQENGNWSTLIALQGGDTLKLETGINPDQNHKQESKKIEVILFLPETGVSSIFRPGLKLPATITGPSSNYDGLITYGKLALTDWVIHSKVLFQPHKAANPPFNHEEKPSAPLVLRLDRPFRFTITGSHGEVLFRGKVENPTENNYEQ